jgi:hypothetical protein
MIYDTLSSKLPVDPSHFSGQSANALSDVRAKYNIFGGPTSISLQSDKLVFDLPNLIPNDFPIVRDIIPSVHDALPTAFPELDYQRVEVNTYDHVELVEQGAVDAFLDRYKLPENEKAFHVPVVSRPGVRFGVLSQDQSWQADFSADRSLMSVNALFVVLNLSLRKVDRSSPYLDKARLVFDIRTSCFSAVGLEDVDASAT